MVDLAQLVDQSLARHGVEAKFDPSRLQWSAWFCVDDRLTLLQVPGKPGLFALAEELAAPPQEKSAAKRLLGLLEITKTEDLGLTLGRLFLSPIPAAPTAGKRIFARYAVIEDDRQRHSAHAAFQRWASAHTEVSGLARSGPQPFTPEASPAPGSSNKEARNGPPEAFFLGF